MLSNLTETEVSPQETGESQSQNIFLGRVPSLQKMVTGGRDWKKKASGIGSIKPQEDKGLER